MSSLDLETRIHRAIAMTAWTFRHQHHFWAPGEVEMQEPRYYKWDFEDNSHLSDKLHLSVFDEDQHDVQVDLNVNPFYITYRNWDKLVRIEVSLPYFISTNTDGKVIAEFEGKIEGDNDSIVSLKSKSSKVPDYRFKITRTRRR